MLPWLVDRLSSYGGEGECFYDIFSFPLRRDGLPVRNSHVKKFFSKKFVSKSYSVLGIYGHKTSPLLWGYVVSRKKKPKGTLGSMN